MRIAAAFICDAAVVREGLGQVLGAGITHLYRQEFPAPAAVSLFILLEYMPGEAPESGQIRMRVLHVDGEAEIAQATIDFQSQTPIDPSAPLMLPVAVPLDGLPLPTPGRYDFELAVDGFPDVVTLPSWAVLTPVP